MLTTARANTPSQGHLFPVPYSRAPDFLSAVGQRKYMAFFLAYSNALIRPLWRIAGDYGDYILL